MLRRDSCFLVTCCCAIIVLRRSYDSILFRSSGSVPDKVLLTVEARVLRPVTPATILKVCTSGLTAWAVSGLYICIRGKQLTSVCFAVVKCYTVNSSIPIFSIVLLAV